MNYKYSLIAAAQMHIEGYFSQKSQAFKRKNPGNLRRKDGIFIQYPSVLEGYTALVKNVTANKGNTLKAYVYKFAPEKDNNNTAAYLSLLCTLTGFGEGEVI